MTILGGHRYLVLLACTVQTSFYCSPPPVPGPRPLGSPAGSLLLSLSKRSPAVSNCKGCRCTLLLQGGYSVRQPIALPNKSLEQKGGDVLALSLMLSCSECKLSPFTLQKRKGDRRHTSDKIVTTSVARWLGAESSKRNRLYNPTATGQMWVAIPHSRNQDIRSINRASPRLPVP